MCVKCALGVEADRGPCYSPRAPLNVVNRMPKDKDKELPEAGMLNLREVPRDAIVKAKIGAALEGLSVKAYIIKLVEAHWVEMEKKGILPKGK
jgi:hypothetical protein